MFACVCMMTIILKSSHEVEREEGRLQRSWKGEGGKERNGNDINTGLVKFPKNKINIKNKFEIQNLLVNNNVLKEYN